MSPGPIMRLLDGDESFGLRVTRLETVCFCYPHCVRHQLTGLVTPSRQPR